MPADAVRPVSWRTADGFGGQPRRRQSGLVGGDIKIGLVERQRFDQRGERGKNRVNLPRDRPIDIEARRHEDQLRALRIAVTDGSAECTPNCRAS